jgi:exodeoxyribonuclease VII small subunit
MSNLDELLKTPLENLTYEQALSQLEQIVTALESNENSLDEALAFFERGQELARYCSDLLDNTELKVKQILGEELADFNPKS